MPRKFHKLAVKRPFGVSTKKLDAELPHKVLHHLKRPSAGKTNVGKKIALNRKRPQLNRRRERRVVRKNRDLCAGSDVK